MLISFLVAENDDGKITPLGEPLCSNEEAQPSHKQGRISARLLKEAFGWL